VVRSQFSAQSGDNPSNFIQHLHKQWDDRLQLESADLLKAYVSDKIALQFHVRCLAVELIEICAVLRSPEALEFEFPRGRWSIDLKTDFARNVR
jgi:hypothetical protein